MKYNADFKSTCCINILSNLYNLSSTHWFKDPDLYKFYMIDNDVLIIKFIIIKDQIYWQITFNPYVIIKYIPIFLDNNSFEKRSLMYWLIFLLVWCPLFQSVILPTTLLDVYKFLYKSAVLIFSSEATL